METFSAKIQWLTAGITALGFLVTALCGARVSAEEVHSFKGLELYSWVAQKSGARFYAVTSGTNRQKNWADLFSSQKMDARELSKWFSSGVKIDNQEPLHINANFDLSSSKQKNVRLSFPASDELSEAFYCKKKPARVAKLLLLDCASVEMVLRPKGSVFEVTGIQKKPGGF